MPGDRGSKARLFIIVFLALSVALLLLGQTMAVFDYDLAARLGMQESPEQVSAYGVQVNRVFGAWCLVYLLFRGESLL